MTLPPLLNDALAFAVQYKYPLVFLGALVEGPLVMIAAGFLLHLGMFSLAPLSAALIVGDLVADVGWYYIGYYFAEPFIRRWGHFFGISPELFEKTKEIFRRHHARILFISKIIMGLGLALGTLIAAGASRVPFRTYILLNSLGEPIFVASMLTLGYAFAQLYGYVAEAFKFGFMAFGAVLAVAFVFGFSRYIRQKTFGQ